MKAENRKWKGHQHTGRLFLGSTLRQCVIVEKWVVRQSCSPHSSQEGESWETRCEYSPKGISPVTYFVLLGFTLLIGSTTS